MHSLLNNIIFKTKVFIDVILKTQESRTGETVKVFENNHRSGNRSLKAKRVLNVNGICSVETEFRVTDCFWSRIVLEPWLGCCRASKCQYIDMEILRRE